MLVSACAAPERLPAVPDDLSMEADVPGMPNVRYWVDGNPEPFIAELELSWAREHAFLAQSGYDGPWPPAYYLVVSGGGDDGAFGAGLLNGWTASGGRPAFKIVTGISTGALIAPSPFSARSTTLPCGRRIPTSPRTTSSSTAA